MAMVKNVFAPFEWLAKLDQIAVVWVNGPTRTKIPFSWLRIWNEATFRYCTDGAANDLQSLCEAGTAKMPHLISGDFDSISNTAKAFFCTTGNEKGTRLVESSDQDTTDLTKTLNLLLEEPKIVFLLGGLNGRFDHVLGTLNTILLHNQKSSLPVFALDDENLITGNTEVRLKLENLTRFCGILPLCQRVTKVKTEDDQEMEYGKLISSCNRIEEPKLQIQTNAPLVFSIELKNAENIW